MIDITTADIVGIMEYVGTLFEDFKPLLILVLGIWLAFSVIEAIIELFKPEREWTQKEADEYYMKKHGN